MPLSRLALPTSLVRGRSPGESEPKRADGRWMGRYYAWTTSGTRKRVTIYGKTRQETAERTREAQERDRQGIPAPSTSRKLGDWLDHWLSHVVTTNRRHATYALYETIVRLYLKPGLGRHQLGRLTVTQVQTFLTSQLATGHSVRKVHVMKSVLSTALARAMREELVTRNVARLTELPTWERQPVTPWTATEARGFLEAARDDPVYPAFVLLVIYGLRRGEVLGLRCATSTPKTARFACASRSSGSEANCGPEQ